LLFSSTAWAAPYTIANSFIAGTPAIAGQVNANFTAAKTAIDDNDTRTTANTASAATNATNITANTVSVASNAANVTTNTTNIAALQTANQTAIATIVNVPANTGTALGDGTALMNAVAGITGSSPTNQFTVKLDAGTYDLGVQMLQLPDGVNIEGVAPGLTIVTSSLPGTATNIVPYTATVRALGGSKISKITIKNTDATGAVFESAAVNASNGSLLLENAELSAPISIMTDGTAALTVTVSSSKLTVTIIRSRTAWYDTLSNPGVTPHTLVVLNSEFGYVGSTPNGFTASCFLSHFTNGTTVPAACF